MITQKLPYDTPSTDVLDVRPEGVICTSGGGLNNPGSYDNGGDPFGAMMLP